MENIDYTFIPLSKVEDYGIQPQKIMDAWHKSAITFYVFLNKVQAYLVYRTRKDICNLSIDYDYHKFFNLISEISVPLNEKNKVREFEYRHPPKLQHLDLRELAFSPLSDTDEYYIKGLASGYWTVNKKDYLPNKDLQFLIGKYHTKNTINDLLKVDELDFNEFEHYTYNLPLNQIDARVLRLIPLKNKDELKSRNYLVEYYHDYHSPLSLIPEENIKIDYNDFFITLKSLKNFAFTNNIKFIDKAKNLREIKKIENIRNITNIESIRNVINIKNIENIRNIKKIKKIESVRNTENIENEKNKIPPETRDEYMIKNYNVEIDIRALTVLIHMIKFNFFKDSEIIKDKVVNMLNASFNDLKRKPNENFNFNHKTIESWFNNKLSKKERLSKPITVGLYTMIFNYYLNDEKFDRDYLIKKITVESEEKLNIKKETLEKWVKHFNIHGLN
ncbi:hypothetical protein I5F05_05030 [Proteus mirabilis]|nr:hypothetical protein [Proteus mirabilis]